MKIARPLARLIESFEKLPGIGPKTAQRLSYYLLHVPQVELEDFSANLASLKKDTVLCSLCKNVGETDPCDICRDNGRDQSVIMVVEQPLDIFALEKTGRFNGLYHVLHGAINPLDNIGPDELYIEDLFRRVKPARNASHSDAGGGQEVKEIIIATNPTMEGDATAMYISKKLKGERQELKVSRLGMGVPTGADLEYADETTLRQAIEGRREIG